MHRRMHRKGSNLVIIHQKKIQTSFTFNAIINHQAKKQSALDILNAFFGFVKSKIEFDSKTTKMFSSVNYMNLRIRR